MAAGSAGRADSGSVGRTDTGLAGPMDIGSAERTDTGPVGRVDAGLARRVTPVRRGGGTPARRNGQIPARWGVWIPARRGPDGHRLSRASEYRHGRAYAYGKWLRTGEWPHRSVADRRAGLGRHDRRRGLRGTRRGPARADRHGHRDGGLRRRPTAAARVPRVRRPRHRLLPTAEARRTTRRQRCPAPRPAPLGTDRTRRRRRGDPPRRPPAGRHPRRRDPGGRLRHGPAHVPRDARPGTGHRHQRGVHGGGAGGRGGDGGGCRERVTRGRVRR